MGKGLSIRRRPARGLKYGNIRVKLAGEDRPFDSMLEAERFGALSLLQRARKISDLRRQVPFPITVNGQRICTYVADFVYTEDGALVVEDAKGIKTDVYKLKKKLMAAVHNINIQEVYAKPRKRVRTAKRSP